MAMAYCHPKRAITSSLSKSFFTTGCLLQYQWYDVLRRTIGAVLLPFLFVLEKKFLRWPFSLHKVQLRATTPTVTRSVLNDFYKARSTKPADKRLRLKINIYLVFCHPISIYKYVMSKAQFKKAPRPTYLDML